ncbi:MAG: enoyl-CoA hydratase-related protein [Actinomycetota bacterium]|nr:enoyl-CoA hydratase-related protein [Actinomycetota bacterium]
MGEQTVLVDVVDQIATVTLNRPDRMNAWNDELAAGLSEAMVRCDEDPDVRVVILTGAGRAFCAGADLQRGGDTFDRRDRPRPERSGPNRLPHQISKPVIAAINGHAVGVGITYPLLADVRIVARDAKIAFAFVRRGMIPELASHAVLPRVLGFSNAADLLMTGRTILGEEAAAMGLATRALDADEVLPAAREMAKEYLLAAPVSVATAKRLMWESLEPALSDTQRRENKIFGWFGQQSDAKEGIASFVERRTPSWTMNPATDMPDIPA